MDEEKDQWLSPYKLNPNQGSINKCLFMWGIVNILKFFFFWTIITDGEVSIWTIKDAPVMYEIIKEHDGWNTL